MPKTIHIANSKKRDAEVAVEQQVRRSKVKAVLPNGEDKINQKLLKNTVAFEYDILLKAFKGNQDKFIDALREKDIEVDLETAGKRLWKTHKLYVDKNNEIVYRLNLYQVVYNPEGEETERNDVNKLPANINSEIPIKWTGKRFDKSEAIRKFVFSRKYQIRHINGVTFDFLYNMAKELQESKTMVLVGGGKHGTDPILLTRGGQPYRGFLEGRVLKDRYSLILHLADIELKAPDL